MASWKRRAVLVLCVLFALGILASLVLLSKTSDSTLESAAKNANDSASSTAAAMESLQAELAATNKELAAVNKELDVLRNRVERTATLLKKKAGKAAPQTRKSRSSRT